MLLLNKHKKNVEGRYYQNDSLTKVKEEWNDGNKKVLLVAPTGSGKTVTAGLIIDDEVNNNGGKVLVVTDRKKLTRQFAERTEADFGIPCGIEMANEGHGGEDVICTTVQTVTNRIQQGKFDPDEFSLLCFDEAHLALGAGFQSVANHFSDSRLVGLTATPRRGDRKDLMAFFNSMVEPVTLPQLIEQGFLAPLTIQNIPIQIELRTKHKTGDYDDEEISHAIEPYLDACANSLIEHGAQRCSLVFLPLIKTSKRFTELLNEKGFNAEHVDGEMGEQAVNAAIKRLELGKIQALCCSQILAIGVDIKPVNLILNLRPTRSWTFFVQVCGRGTRTFIREKDNPKSLWPDKTDCVLLDPTWLTEEHSLLQRPSVLVAKDEEEAECIDMALKKGGGGDLMQAVAGAAHEREEKMRQKLEAMAKRKARTVNAMDFMLRMHLPDYADYEPLNALEARPIKSALSEKQMAWLVKSKFDLESIKNFGHAKHILNALGERAKAGLATMGQVKYAESLGYKEKTGKEAFDSTFKEVSEFIDKNIQKPAWQAGWQRKH